jgi:hypothetical protein
MINNAAQWILEHSKIEFLDSFVVNGITFELMSLSKENIAAARVLTSSKNIIELAANGGIAINKNRMIEDESLIDSLAAYWGHPEVKAFEDPTIMFSVGEKVCELSGLSEVLSEMILDEEVAEEAEEARLAAIEKAHGEAIEDQKLLDDATNGDTETPDALLGKLNQAAEDYHAA